MIIITRVDYAGNAATATTKQYMDDDEAIYYWIKSIYGDDIRVDFWLEKIQAIPQGETIAMSGYFIYRVVGV